MNEERQYNTFLSWSGEHSHGIAALLRDWLPNVVPSARPWISSEDIAKGSVWPTELNQSLASCDIGVVVLSPDNLNSPWLLFEAGVLFKARGERPVFTLCCGIEPPIVGPLGQFQTTRCDAKDMLRLVQDINSAIGANHDKNRVQGWFEKFWPEFSQKEKNIRETYSGAHNVTPASDRALLEEILSAIRPLRRLQVEIEDSGRERARSVEWYRPFWVAKNRECNWVLINKNAIARFLTMQMRDPERTDRVIQFFWDKSEAISGFAESHSEDTYEGMTFTWHARYDRGLDGHYVYVDAISVEESK